ncbi:peptidoglycan-binding domain-containing protein [Rhodopseudomonas parapalustris]
MSDNKGLVEHAKQAKNEGWGYVYGTFGQVLTPDLLAQKARQYGEAVNNYFDFIKSHWMGKHVADCVGLIKSFYWNGKYDGNTDVSADGMYSKANEKGDINSIPDIPGICVHKSGHIGIYIGGGQVIESHGTKYGVIQTPLKGGTPWTHWLKCPYIDYVTTAAPQPQDTNKPSKIPFRQNVLLFQQACNKVGVTDENGNRLDEDGKLGDHTKAAMKKAEAVIRRGAKNALVGVIQTILKISVDNSYGKDPYHETYDAIGNFQEAKNLKKDYTVGPKTWEALLTA